MIDHIGIDVSDYQRAKDFYSKALAPLGIELIMGVSAEQTGTRAYAGMGQEDNPFFWFGEKEANINPIPIHIAFSAKNADVENFYKAALEAGGEDNGAPGLHPHYHQNYYGALLLILMGIILRQFAIFQNRPE